MNTLLDEPKRVVALPILNETKLLGDPVYPSVVADKLSVEDGQYQSSHIIRSLIELLLKNSPFEPLSIKLLLYVLLLKTVMNSP